MPLDMSDLKATLAGVKPITPEYLTFITRIISQILAQDGVRVDFSYAALNPGPNPGAVDERVIDRPATVSESNTLTETGLLRPIDGQERANIHLFYDGVSFGVLENTIPTSSGGAEGAVGGASESDADSTVVTIEREFSIVYPNRSHINGLYDAIALAYYRTGISSLNIKLDESTPNVTGELIKNAVADYVNNPRNASYIQVALDSYNQNNGVESTVRPRAFVNGQWYSDAGATQRMTREQATAYYRKLFNDLRFSSNNPGGVAGNGLPTDIASIPDTRIQEDLYLLEKATNQNITGLGKEIERRIATETDALNSDYRWSGVKHYGTSFFVPVLLNAGLNLGGFFASGGTYTAVTSVLTSVTGLLAGPLHLFAQNATAPQRRFGITGLDINTLTANERHQIFDNPFRVFEVNMLLAGLAGAAAQATTGVLERVSFINPAAGVAVRTGVDIFGRLLAGADAGTNVYRGVTENALRLGATPTRNVTPAGRAGVTGFLRGYGASIAGLGTGANRREAFARLTTLLPVTATNLANSQYIAPQVRMALERSTNAFNMISPLDRSMWTILAGAAAGPVGNAVWGTVSSLLGIGLLIESWRFRNTVRRAFDAIVGEAVPAIPERSSRTVDLNPAAVFDGWVQSEYINEVFSEISAKRERINSNLSIFVGLERIDGADRNGSAALRERQIRALLTSLDLGENVLFVADRDTTAADFQNILRRHYGAAPDADITTLNIPGQAFFLDDLSQLKTFIDTTVDISASPRNNTLPIRNYNIFSAGGGNALYAQLANTLDAYNVGSSPNNPNASVRWHTNYVGSGTILDFVNHYTATKSEHSKTDIIIDADNAVVDLSSAIEEFGDGTNGIPEIDTPPTTAQINETEIELRERGVSVTDYVVQVEAEVSETFETHLMVRRTLRLAILEASRNSITSSGLVVSTQQLDTLRRYAAQNDEALKNAARLLARLQKVEADQGVLSNRDDLLLLATEYRLELEKAQYVPGIENPSYDPELLINEGYQLTSNQAYRADRAEKAAAFVAALEAIEGISDTISRWNSLTLAEKNAIAVTILDAAKRSFGVDSQINVEALTDTIRSQYDVSPDAAAFFVVGESDGGLRIRSEDTIYLDFNTSFTKFISQFAHEFTHAEQYALLTRFEGNPSTLSAVEEFRNAFVQSNRILIKNGYFGQEPKTFTTAYWRQPIEHDAYYTQDAVQAALRRSSSFTEFVASNLAFGHDFSNQISANYGAFIQKSFENLKPFYLDKDDLFRKAQSLANQTDFGFAIAQNVTGQVPLNDFSSYTQSSSNRQLTSNALGQFGESWNETFDVVTENLIYKNLSYDLNGVINFSLHDIDLSSFFGSGVDRPEAARFFARSPDQNLIGNPYFDSSLRGVSITQWELYQILTDPLKYEAADFWVRVTNDPSYKNADGTIKPGYEFDNTVIFDPNDVSTHIFEWRKLSDTELAQKGLEFYKYNEQTGEYNTVSAAEFEVLKRKARAELHVSLLSRQATDLPDGYKFDDLRRDIANNKVSITEIRNAIEVVARSLPENGSEAIRTALKRDRLTLLSNLQNDAVFNILGGSDTRAVWNQFVTSEIRRAPVQTYDQVIIPESVGLTGDAASQRLKADLSSVLGLFRLGGEANIQTALVNLEAGLIGGSFTANQILEAIRSAKEFGLSIKGWRRVASGLKEAADIISSAEGIDRTEWLRSVNETIYNDPTGEAAERTWDGPDLDPTSDGDATRAQKFGDLAGANPHVRELFVSLAQIAWAEGRIERGLLSFDEGSAFLDIAKRQLIDVARKLNETAYAVDLAYNADNAPRLVDLLLVNLYELGVTSSEVGSLSTRQRSAILDAFFQVGVFDLDSSKALLEGVDLFEEVVDLTESQTTLLRDELTGTGSLAADFDSALNTWEILGDSARQNFGNRVAGKLEEVFGISNPINVVYADTHPNGAVAESDFVNNTITIYRAALAKPLDLISALSHEYVHFSQRELIGEYFAGELIEGSREYVAASLLAGELDVQSSTNIGQDHLIPYAKRLSEQQAYYFEESLRGKLNQVREAKGLTPVDANNNPIIDDLFAIEPEILEALRGRYKSATDAELREIALVRDISAVASGKDIDGKITAALTWTSTEALDFLTRRKLLIGSGTSYFWDVERVERFISNGSDADVSLFTLALQKSNPDTVKVIVDSLSVSSDKKIRNYGNAFAGSNKSPSSKTSSIRQTILSGTDYTFNAFTTLVSLRGIISGWKNLSVIDKALTVTEFVGGIVLPTIVSKGIDVAFKIAGKALGAVGKAVKGGILDVILAPVSFTLIARSWKDFWDNNANLGSLEYKSLVTNTVITTVTIAASITLTAISIAAVVSTAVAASVLGTIAASAGPIGLVIAAAGFIVNGIVQGALQVHEYRDYFASTADAVHQFFAAWIGIETEGFKAAKRRKELEAAGNTAAEIEASYLETWRDTKAYLSDTLAESGYGILKVRDRTTNVRYDLLRVQTHKIVSHLARI